MITIWATRYPITLNWDKIIERARQENVVFEYLTTNQSQFMQLPLDLAGKQDPLLSFRTCHMANSCLYLVNGRLFTCPPAAFAPYFNQAFGTELAISVNDAIDIHQATSMTEILEFLAKPIQFCRYCDVAARTKRGCVPWRVSKKEISEWT